MRVIRPGRVQKGWAKEVECTGNGNGDGGCGALLLVEEDDLFGTEKCLGPDEVEYLITFQCPACGVSTNIDAPIQFILTIPSKYDWINKRLVAEARSDEE